MWINFLWKTNTIIFFKKPVEKVFNFDILPVDKKTLVL